MNDKVIQFKDYHPSTPSLTSSGPTVRIRNDDDASTRSGGKKYMSPSRLYPFDDPQKLELQRPLKLIQEAESYAVRAMEELAEGDRIASALAMQHLRALMPELFCHRNLGDGFASLISCIFYAIKNHGDQEFERDQVTEIKFAFNQLSQNPFVVFDEAQRIIDGLEQVGFAVEPPEYELLGELLDGDSLR